MSCKDSDVTNPLISLNAWGEDKTPKCLGGGGGGEVYMPGVKVKHLNALGGGGVHAWGEGKAPKCLGGGGVHAWGVHAWGEGKAPKCLG